MTATAQYQNHYHYIQEGWAREPKESFKALAGHIEEACGTPGGRLLDIGCATGELIGYLKGRFPAMTFAGVDVFDELLDEAGRFLPDATFVKASATNLPASMNGEFDIVTAMGCMSIFDETSIAGFWDNLLRVTRPGGTIFVLAPLNEYGVDTMIRHRKRLNERRGPWETGWNIFSFQTVEEIVQERGKSCHFEKFSPGIPLPRRDDPVRTWTMATEANSQQLTNGMKLLVDHYFIVVHN